MKRERKSERLEFRVTPTFKARFLAWAEREHYSDPTEGFRRTFELLMEKSEIRACTDNVLQPDAKEARRVFR